MPELHIENLFCHEALDVELLPGVNLITGKNTSGKTSLAMIIAALAAHYDNPASVSATSKKAYIRDGNLEGVAMMDGVKWTPQASGIGAPVGIKPTAARQAVGLTDFIEGARGGKERAQLWESMFLPDNPREILEKVWPSILGKKQLESILGIIDKQGWDAALTIYENKRLESKRRWQQVTGEPRYGAEKAANWLPAAWRPEIEGHSEDDMTAALTDARDALTVANSVQSIEQERIDKAREVQEKVIPAKEGELKTAREAAASIAKEITDLSAQYSEHKATYDALVKACTDAKATINDKAPLTCPGCGAGLVVRDDTLRGYASPEPEDIENAKRKLETAAPEITVLREQCERLINLSKSGKTKLAEANRTAHGIEGALNQLKLQARDAELTAQDATPEAEIARLGNGGTGSPHEPGCVQTVVRSQDEPR